MKDTGSAMLTEKFDAFGEAMPDAVRSENETSTPVAGNVGRIGPYVFWLVVVAIIAARITCYPAERALEVSSAIGAGPVLAR
ncbi:MAG TPA: hypothetical protein VJV58_19975 [Bradyrhizobium sp.]|jgi:hypothetical protein|uniref:hypothetical protein n=1 Tax=Bradyrhizobium sp. TaxID=376 RepID=UPI002B4A96E0|nr:hypothetical protein [Bradyrhizobium sp.]HKO73215.1 hypothetical protein [Bradyrhizobium sp.]